MKKFYLFLLSVMCIAIVACTGPTTTNPDEPNDPNLPNQPGQPVQPDIAPSDSTINNEFDVLPPYYLGRWESEQMTDTMYIELSLLESIGLDLSELAPYLAMFGDNLNVAIMPSVSVSALLQLGGSATIGANVAMNMAFHVAASSFMPEQFLPMPIPAMDTTITEYCNYEMTMTQLILTQPGDSAQNTLVLDVNQLSDTQVEISLSEESAQRILATIPTDGSNPMEDAVLTQIEAAMSSLRFKMTKKK